MGYHSLLQSGVCIYLIDCDICAVQRGYGEGMADGSVGANVDEAYAGGNASADAAARLRDLPLDFSEAVEEAKDAVSGDPGVTQWGNFEGMHEHHMRSVTVHAETLAENIMAGSYDIAVTDLEAAERYDIPMDELGPL